MAIHKIKPLNFKNLKAADKEQQFSDGGGLYVRIRTLADGGAVSFRLRYYFEGKQKWLTLEAETLSDARKEAVAQQALIKSGACPVRERQLKTASVKEQQLAAIEAITKLQARLTVNGLFDLWKTKALSNRKDLPEIIRTFNKDALPFIGHLFVEDVRKHHILLITDTLLERGCNRSTRMLLGLIRQMFNFAVDRDLIEFNPTTNINKSKLGAKDTERGRILSDGEIKSLARLCVDAQLLPSTEAAIWIMLSTLCRVGELCKAKQSDIDLDKGEWTIPKENSKNGKAHLIHLSDFAIKQFNQLFVTKVTDSDWLYPDTNGTSPISPRTIAGQLHIRQATDNRRGNQALLLPGGQWSAHDLRRTGATLMGNLLIRPDVIEKCLNHTEPNKLKRTYQLQSLVEEQKQAWHLLGERLELLITPNSNVTPIRKSS
jgi:integrase